MTTLDTPNADSAANVTPAAPSLEDIAAKMTAMTQQTMRNQLRSTADAATGSQEPAGSQDPVAPTSDTTVPEDSPVPDLDPVLSVEPADAPEEVSTEATADTTADELIDFVEFADANPNARFRFMRNGEEIVIDAKKAAAILGQGSAIHEEARQLKIQKSEFEEYQKTQQARQEGLTLAMEFTVQPQLRQAYDEIVRTQSYQTTFAQQLAQTQDAAQRARIQASMEQNERYIQQQSQHIAELKPAVDQFRQMRQQQVSQVIDQNRKNFQDRELRNEFVFRELRDKISRDWSSAQGELIPGVPNIDLITSDEHILSLIRDGLKFRDRPAAKSAGGSIAALTRPRGTTPPKTQEQSLERLREQAKKGGREGIQAADNLLTARLKQIRSARAGG
jgi:hypothetical protein